jgi:hypothetical protein
MMMRQARLSAWVLVSLLATAVGACNVAPPEEEKVPAEAEVLGEKSDELLSCSPYAYCGPGYARDVHCSILCGSCPYGRYGSPPNATECYYIAPTGSITAQPTQVSILPGSLGTTNICASSNVINSEVWVSMDGAPESLFASNYTSGCASAPWIQIGHSYQFRLYAGSAHSTLLASVTVTGVESGPQPDPCESCYGNTSCFCGDGVCRSPMEYCP